MTPARVQGSLWVQLEIVASLMYVSGIAQHRITITTADPSQAFRKFDLDISLEDNYPIPLPYA